MPKQTPEQRIATLEKALQALAQDYNEQIYGHQGPVEWDPAPDSQGWLRIVPNRDGEMPSRVRVLHDA